MSLKTSDDELRELESSRRCRELVNELMEAIDPIKGWGGDQPGDAVVYSLVAALKDKYGGWESVTAYRKAHIPRRIRDAVFSRDGRNCLKCGSGEYLTLDHIFPERLGGETTEANLRVLCRSCNSRKGVSIEWE